MFTHSPISDLKGMHSGNRKSQPKRFAKLMIISTLLSVTHATSCLWLCGSKKAIVRYTRALGNDLKMMALQYAMYDWEAKKTLPALGLAHLYRKRMFHPGLGPGVEVSGAAVIGPEHTILMYNDGINGWYTRKEAGAVPPKAWLQHRECEKCNGRGKVPDDGCILSGETACPDCGGKGRIKYRDWEQYTGQHWYEKNNGCYMYRGMHVAAWYICTPDRDFRHDYKRYQCLDPERIMTTPTNPPDNQEWGYLLRTPTTNARVRSWALTHPRGTPVPDYLPYDDRPCPTLRLRVES